MFNIVDDTIHITRGDMAKFTMEAATIDGKYHRFQPGDVIQFKVFEKKQPDAVVFQKYFTVDYKSCMVNITLTGSDTEIGDPISHPVKYWYEIKLNPDTAPQTLMGYDTRGAKLFILYPGGGESK